MDITLEAVAYSAILGLRFADRDRLRRPARRGRRPRRAAARRAARVRALRRDRRGGDAAGARARARRAPARRRAAHRSARRASGAVAVLRAVTAGALDRATDVAATLEVRGFALGARGPAAERAPVVAPRPRVRRLGARAGRARDRGRRRGLGRVRGLPAPGPARSAATRCCSPPPSPPACCSRSPTAGGWGGERARARRGVSYAYPGEPRRAARRDAERRAGRVRRRLRRLRARASRRCCGPPPAWCRTSTAARSRAGCAAPGSTRASTGRASSPPSPARCCRTPRRRC